MSNIVRIKKGDWTHEQWLEARRYSIGGSEAPAIVGLSKWSTPYSVWANKMGLTKPVEANEAMRQGTDLEDYVARRFMEQTGKRVYNTNFLYKNNDYPFAHANVDRLIYGEDAGLECKTTSEMNLKKFKNGEYPESYYVQCMHYMMVTGCTHWYLAVLVYSKGFYVFRIDRDEEEISSLARQEAEFWKHIENNTPPAVDGKEATSEALSEVFAETSEDVIDLNDSESAEMYLDIISKLEAEIKEKEEAVERWKNDLKLLLGNHEKAICKNYSVSWKMQAGRKTFDKARLSKEHPELNISDYERIGTPYKAFKITRKE